jgi:quercetin dioxygenase-like cupin family protein
MSATSFATIILSMAVASAAAAAELKRTELMRTPVEGLAGHEGSISTVEMPPESATPKHSHPGQEYVYVISGAVVLEPDGAAPVTVTAGKAHVSPANQVHVARNPSKTEAAKVVVIGFVPTGHPGTNAAE